MCVCATFMCSLVCTPCMLNHGMCSFMQHSICLSRLLSFYVFLYLLIFIVVSFVHFSTRCSSPLFLEHTYFYRYYMGLNFLKTEQNNCVHCICKICHLISCIYPYKGILAHKPLPSHAVLQRSKCTQPS